MEIVIAIVIIGGVVWYIKSRKNKATGKAGPRTEPTQEDIDAAEGGIERK